MSQPYKTALMYTHNVGYLPLSFPGLAGVSEVMEEVDCRCNDAVAKNKVKQELVTTEVL